MQVWCTGPCARDQNFSFMHATKHNIVSCWTNNKYNKTQLRAQFEPASHDPGLSLHPESSSQRQPITPYVYYKSYAPWGTSRGLVGPSELRVLFPEPLWYGPAHDGLRASRDRAAADTLPLEKLFDPEELHESTFDTKLHNLPRLPMMKTNCSTWPRLAGWK